MREVQPMQWQFIETPQDGTLMLTWQPLDVMGTTFASDGYIWADAEHRFTSEVRGYVSAARFSGRPGLTTPRPSRSSSKDPVIEQRAKQWRLTAENVTDYSREIPVTDYQTPTLACGSRTTRKPPLETTFLPRPSPFHRLCRRKSSKED